MKNTEESQRTFDEVCEDWQRQMNAWLDENPEVADDLRIQRLEVQVVHRASIVSAFKLRDHVSLTVDPDELQRVILQARYMTLAWKVLRFVAHWPDQPFSRKDMSFPFDAPSCALINQKLIDWQSPLRLVVVERKQTWTHQYQLGTLKDETECHEAAS
jgi:hypothetical protein